MGAGESAIGVIAAGGGGAGQLEIAREAAAVGGDADQVLGLELVGDPEGDFAGGVVAQDEEVMVGDFEGGAGAGGEAKAAGLSREGGNQGQDQGGEARRYRLSRALLDRRVSLPC